jgi:hypothetical protein
VDLFSVQSKDCLDRAFQKAAKACLARSETDSCEIAQANAAASQAAGGERLVLVTISSFTFRLLVIFHLRESEQVREYFIGAGAGRTLEESFYEVANMCCGALNREIAHQYTHLAMSIPFTLAGPCIGYLHELRPQHVCDYLITLNSSIQVRVTLCMCCTVPFEMRSVELDDEPVGGELEMF